jgi:hypothetical protein
MNSMKEVTNTTVRLAPMMRQALELVAHHVPEARVIGGAWMRPAHTLARNGLCTLHRLNERKAYHEIRLTEAGVALLRDGEAEAW